MYDQSKLSGLIRFARVETGSTVISVYPGDGDWTRHFSDVVGPEGRVYTFVPTEIAAVMEDHGRMQTLSNEPGRENIEAVSADLGAMPEVTQPADVLWMHLFYHDLHTKLIGAKARLQPPSIEPSTSGLSPVGPTSSWTTPPPSERARATPSRCIGLSLRPSARR
jgi:predicted methyltransferase